MTREDAPRRRKVGGEWIEKVAGGPVLVAIFLIFCTLPSSAGELTDLKARIGAFDAHARYPLPELSERDHRRLLEGKIVRVREGSGPGPQRVTGLIVAPASKEALFISASDPHLSAVEEVVEVRANPQSEGYPHQWFQYLSLPGPFADRYWVIDVEDNLELARQTEGRSWEHGWALTEGGPGISRGLVEAGQVQGVAPDALESAVYVDVNTGAYLYIDLPGERTLFGFHATSAVGGRVPDGVVARWSMLTVGNLLKNIVGRVEEACAHYDEGHAPVLGGDGAPIKPGCRPSSK